MEYDIAVIGGGPAGLAAASYGLQAQLRVALIAPSLGGRVSSPFQLRGLPAVESVRGAELVQQFAAYVEAKITTMVPLGADYLTADRHGDFQVTLENGELLSAASVILCTGAKAKRLHVPGEDEFVGRGVSFSATSHAQFFRNRNVAVVGGERALNDALKVAAIAKHVSYIVGPDAHSQSLRLLEAASHDPKISIYPNWKVQEIVGDHFVTGVVLAAGQGETRRLAVDGIFVELGLLPNNDLARNGLGGRRVEMDKAGRVVINHQCETSVPGLFAAGDVTNVYAEQIPVAIGEGAKAALTAWSYLAAHKRQRFAHSVEASYS
jgi:thioredoxin reductase